MQQPNTMDYMLIQFDVDKTLAVVPTEGSFDNFNILKAPKVKDPAGIIVYYPPDVKNKQKKKPTRYSATLLRYGGIWFFVAMCI